MNAFIGRLAIFCFSETKNKADSLNRLYYLIWLDLVRFGLKPADEVSKIIDI